MGTSSLYKGPKITSLLPSDYNPDVNPELDVPDETIPTKDEAGEAESQQDDTENEESNEQKEDQSNQPSKDRKTKCDGFPKRNVILK